jgi:hypothetical protein
VAVAFDAAGPTGASTPAVTSAGPLTWTHVCGASATVLLVEVGVDSSADGSLTVSTPTYGGQAMAPVGSKVHTNGGTQGFIQLFKLVNPPTGSNSVSVSVTGGTPGRLWGGSVSYSGAGDAVASGTPTTGSGTSPSMAIPSASSSNMVVGFLGNGSDSTTATAGTSRFNSTLTSVGFQACNNGAISDATGTGSNVTISWTQATDFWAVIGVEVQAGATAGTVPVRYRMPGKTWKRRFQHPRRPLSIPPSLAAVTNLGVSVKTRDEVSASAGVAHSVTSFSPAAGSMVRIDAAWLDATDQLGKTFTCVDNHGNTYSPLPSGQGGDADGGCYLLVFDFTYTSAPGATTVTITASGTGATAQADCLIQPYEITNQDPDQSTAAHNKFSEAGTSTTTYLIATTPTRLGSVIFVLGAPNHNGGATGAVTANANTVTDVDWDNANVGSRGTLGRSITPTTSLTSTTYGWTSVNPSPFGYGVMVSEVLPLAAGSDATATAGLAAAIGTAQSPDVAVDDTVTAGLATATGTAQQPAIQVDDTVTAGLAAATGTAQQPAVRIDDTVTAGLAAATGTAQQPAVRIDDTVTAGLASASGTAQSPSVQVTATAGLATAAGTAQSPTVSTSGNTTVTAGLAAATGAAQSPAAQVTVFTGLAAATGTGQQPAVRVDDTTTAGLATATGTAQSPSVRVDDTVTAGLAAATGTAQQPAVRVDDAVSAGLATATGTAQSPVPAVAAATGLATAAGIAQSPSVRVDGTVTAGLAAATGTARTPSVSTSGNTNAPAGLATATGTAQSPSVATTGDANVNAGLASGTGIAQPPVTAVTVTAGLAAATGAAQSPSVTTTGNATANAGLAAATGAAQSPLVAIIVFAGNASAAATASNAAPGRVPGTAAASGVARAPALSLIANAQAATALAAALQPVAQGRAAVVKGGSTGTSVTEAAIMTATVTSKSGATASVGETTGTSAAVGESGGTSATVTSPGSSQSSVS